MPPRNVAVKDRLRMPLIGLQGRVVRSACKNYVGIKGTVVDETKNILVFRVGDRIKRVPKSTSTFRFELDEKLNVEVEGWVIAGRPEDRLRRPIRRGW